MPRAYIHAILARAHALHAHTRYFSSCFSICFVRLAWRSTSQPSRNPRGPRTRVWYRPIYPCSPEASDGLTLSMGGGVLVALSALCIPAMHTSRPCPVPFWESTRQVVQRRALVLHTPRPGYATVST
ncbi:hypothetical protein V8C44DRAFT_334664 [Trichoderma aethiopicum]